MPAGLSLATKMDVRISSMNVARKNVGDAQSMIGIAEGAMGGISDTLKAVRDLTLQAKNDTLGADERAAIQSSIDSLVSEIDDYSSQAQYNNISLLDGTLNASIQSGPDASSTTSVTISQAYDSAGLSVDSLDVSSSANAATAITAIDAALSTVDSGRTSMGSLDRRFDSKMSFIDTSIENLTASLSRIEDVDYAQAQAENIKLQTQYQAGLSAYMSAIQMPQSILNIL